MAQPTFVQFAFGFAEERSPLGDLARDMREDWDSGEFRATGVHHWKRRLNQLGACEAAKEALVQIHSLFHANLAQ